MTSEEYKKSPTPLSPLLTLPLSLCLFLFFCLSRYASHPVDSAMMPLAQKIIPKRSAITQQPWLLIRKMLFSIPIDGPIVSGPFSSSRRLVLAIHQ
jgi:hypothetical protein